MPVKICSPATPRQSHWTAASQDGKGPELASNNLGNSVTHGQRGCIFQRKNVEISIENGDD
jgi:hypothetical protein